MRKGAQYFSKTHEIFTSIIPEFRVIILVLTRRIIYKFEHIYLIFK